MPQNDFSIANQGFPAFRADLNSALQALASNSSGSSAPGTTYANQLWYDTSTNQLKMRNASNSGWVTLAAFDQVADELQIRSAVIQAVDGAGVVIKTDEGTTRLTVADDGTVTLANDLVVTGDISAATINGIPLRPGVLDPENRIINGAFDFWQRGTSSSVSAYGTADRWAHFFSGGSITVSRQDFIAADGPLGVTTPSFFLRYLVSGQTTGNFATLQQRIEGGRSYAGQTITVLGWARRSSGSGNIACRLTQHFGTGGSPSADVSVSGQAITLGATFAPFALTFSVPNVSGKTFGTNVNDYLNLIFDISGGSAAINAVTVDLWGIHIKVGTHTADATSLYRQPELGPELARCQRYYCTVNANARFPASAAGQIVDTSVYWPVTMRAAPTVARSGSSTNTSSVTINNADTQGLRFSIISAAAGDCYALLNAITADSEL